MVDKIIRLDSRFSMLGAFWRPETPSEIMTGTLVADEKTVNFITAPVFERDISIGPGTSAMPDTTMVPAFHGFTEDGPYTLCQVVEQGRPGCTNFTVGQAITARSFRVLSCVGGMHVNGIDDQCLTSARYTFEGLNAWFPRAFDARLDSTHVVVTVPREPRQIQDFCLIDTRARITVKVVPQFVSNIGDPSQLSKSIVSVEAESSNPESLNWYRKIGARLENLFSLLTGGSVLMETLSVHRGDETGYLISKRLGSVHHFDRLQCVIYDPNQLGRAMVTWLCLPMKFDSVESLALEVLRKSKLFIETEFLALAQALEGFHRATADIAAPDRRTLRRIRKEIRATLEAQTVDARLKERICNSMMHADDLTLAARLNALCGLLSITTLANMGITPDQLVRSIVDTRNFYTHAGSGEGSQRKPVKGKEMFLLNQKMRSLLRGVMLLHLGLPEGQIADVLARESTKWQ